MCRSSKFGAPQNLSLPQNFLLSKIDASQNLSPSKICCLPKLSALSCSLLNLYSNPPLHTREQASNTYCHDKLHKLKWALLWRSVSRVADLLASCPSCNAITRYILYKNWPKSLSLRVASLKFGVTLIGLSVFLTSKPQSDLSLINSVIAVAKKVRLGGRWSRFKWISIIELWDPFVVSWFLDSSTKPFLSDTEIAWRACKGSTDR